MVNRYTKMPTRSFLLRTLCLSGLLLAGGCAFAPGSHLDYQAQSAPIDALVDVEPITLGLVNAQRGAIPRDEALRRASEQQRQDIEAYDYRIGKGDVLSIIVYDHPELTIPAGGERSAAESGNSVHQDGAIFYPYIGRVEVEGKTLSEVRELIAQQLAEYIAEPQVEVRVAAFNSQDVQVTGEVNDPARLPITNVPMTVLDAISQVGGLTEQANWHGVQLNRDGEIRNLSLYDMLNHGELSQDLLLRGGDVLHVPDLADQRVYVMGEVGQPQALPMGRSRMSLTEALARAGSFNEAQADASGIFVIRRSPEHSDKLATVYQLDARHAAAMVLGTKFQLEPTDIVYVTTTPVGRWNRVISQMLPTVTSIYQVTRAINDVRDLRDDF